VQHSKGPLGLGTLAVMPIRHIVHVSDLTSSESAELGPLLQRTSAAVTATMNPEQVYVCLWSHADAVPGRIHFVVQPACRDDMTRHNAYGPVLRLAMSEANQVPGKAAVEEVCVRIRAELRASG
jgi:diadenosine tetraphosphate (Ap4A) HIT family hydrolase